MALNVWFPQDLKNALLSAEQASSSALRAAGGDDNNDAFVKGYQTGYRTALLTLALAFGLSRVDGCQEVPAPGLTFLTAIASDP